MEITTTQVNLCNPAEKLRSNAEAFPDKVALHAGKKIKEQIIYHSFTYAEIEKQSNEFANFLSKSGIRQGDKAVLMVKPSVTLYAIVYALFKIGAIPVIVDPGMGIKRMLHCYKSTKASAFIGIPIAHLIRKLSPKTFASLKVNIVVKGEMLVSSAFATKPGKRDFAEFPIAPTQPDDLAIINFTTGSTGPAKGVEYNYSNTLAMADMLSAQFGQGPDSVDLVTVPLFGVLGLMFGSTIVLPVMNPAKPAEAHPLNIIGPIQKFNATYMFASPALINQVASYSSEHPHIKLNSLSVVNSGGAPITIDTMLAFKKLLDRNARFYTTWGATEGLPLTSIEFNDVIIDTRRETNEGKGNCIGHPVQGLKVRVAEITESEIEDISKVKILETGRVGELLVSGPNISKHYYDNEKADSAHKIKDGDNFWHRMGDLGSLDETGRVWFCGRKSQRVSISQNKTLYTCQIEGIANGHKDVYRSALIGLKARQQTIPVICIEPNKQLDKAEKKVLKESLMKLMQQHTGSKEVKQVVFEEKFPVDIRHNSKIKREALSIKYQERFDNNGLDKLGQPSFKFKYNHAMLIPIFGWALIAWGLVFPFESIFMKTIWWIDIFLSVVVHAAQILLAIPKGLQRGYSRWASAIYTLIFGATWWKVIEGSLKSLKQP